MERGERGWYDADRAAAMENKADEMLNEMVANKLKIRRIKQKRGVSDPPHRRKKTQWVGENAG